MLDASKFPKVFLIVLDGFGDGKNSPFNAIEKSHMPFYQNLARTFPRAQLVTCGEAVGLPPGVMGNSEVGHMNMGAGRIVYQELTRINKAIRDGDFARNKEINAAIDAAKKTGGRVHIMGLLSDAGVHATMEHIKQLITLASAKVPVTVHAFTDGRDTPPSSGVNYVKELGEFLRQYPAAVIGSISGRYYAMDRDNRWDRVEKAWKALTGQTEPHPYHNGNGVGAAIKVVEESYAKEIGDEFIEPTRFEPEAGRGHIADGDAVIFANFRSDRARELTRAFTEKNFKEFDTGTRPKLSYYLCLTQYDKTFGLPVAYPPQNLTQILPDVLAEHRLKQLRIAETEKYAHVTFFFNGGREKPYNDESRVLVPSPKDVATYDLKPEMSAFELADKVAERLARGDLNFVLLNFANADMVGHTGNYEAAIKALEALDKCLNKAVTAALKAGYTVFITADHGNIEEMRDDHDNPHTQHTLNPVPLLLVSNQFKYRVKDGILADLAPTILELMGIAKPNEMTQSSLLTGSRT
ncbi:MAG: 2,3-bisphosphoglycerate-independent phosphoglycerate mutase [Deltaproteobacteria bacterium]|nr:2,3-bisphosphoglycerate-independent phosphoglycerate mutase [Deltaproteobacteria bacterium]